VLAIGEPASGRTPDDVIPLLIRAYVEPTAQKPKKPELGETPEIPKRQNSNRVPLHALHHHHQEEVIPSVPKPEGCSLCLIS